MGPDLIVPARFFSEMGMKLRINIYPGNVDVCSMFIVQYSIHIESGRENRTKNDCLPGAYSGFISPCCQAKTAAWVRSPICSLPGILLTWPFTVFSLSTNCSAILVLECPSANNRSTSSSRSVSWAKAGGMLRLADRTSSLNIRALGLQSLGLSVEAPAFTLGE